MGVLAFALQMAGPLAIEQTVTEALIKVVAVVQLYVFIGNSGAISVDTFCLDMSFMLVAMLVVGGLRSAAGAVVGVTAVSGVVEIFRQLQNGVVLGPVHLAVPAGLRALRLPYSCWAS